MRVGGPYIIISYLNLWSLLMVKFMRTGVSAARVVTRGLMGDFG